MKLIHRFSMSLALGFMLAAGGCGEGDSNGAAPMASSSAISALKHQYADEIKSYEDKIAQLKKDAAGVEDEKLGELTTSVDHKLMAIKAKIESLKPDQIRVDDLQTDVGRMIGELKSLHEEAMARLKLVKR